MLSALSLLLLLALTAWVYWFGPFPGDDAIGRYAQGDRVPTFVADAADFVLDAGRIEFVAPCIVGVLWLVVKSGLGWAIVGRWLLAGCAVLAALILKKILGPTPIMIELRGTAANFPSGHAAFALGFLGLAAWDLRAAGARWCAGIVLCTALTVASAQILGAAHFPSDVLAGGLLACFWLALMRSLNVALFARTPRNIGERRPV